MVTSRTPSGPCQRARRETARDALEIGEHAVAPLVLQPIEGGTEKLVVMHRPGLLDAYRQVAGRQENGIRQPASDLHLEAFEPVCRAVIAGCARAVFLGLPHPCPLPTASGGGTLSRGAEVADRSERDDGTLPALLRERSEWWIGWYSLPRSVANSVGTRNNQYVVS